MSRTALSTAAWSTRPALSSPARYAMSGWRELGAINSGYIPEQKYVRALLKNLHEMSEDGDVVIH
jgi:hypothetical protein